MVWTLGGLGGCYDLQTALEVRSDLRFEISDLDYLYIHVHIAYIGPFDSLGGYYSLGGLYNLQIASEIRSDLRFEISDLN